MTAILLDLLLLAASIGLLWKGAEWIVESAAKIGRSAGLSELVIGLTVVAFGTSAPEFAVTLSAAISGRGSIAVSNVIGSNVFNLGVILGGAALVRALPSDRATLRRDTPVLVGVALLVVAFLSDGRLVRWEGALLFAGLVGYLALLLSHREALPAEDLPAGRATPLTVAVLLAGLAAVAGGGHLLVGSASDLARVLGTPEWLIGLTVVAAGTSASELATSLVAVTRGRPAMLVGNLIGSDIFNMLGVLGLAGGIAPIRVGDQHAGGLAGLVLTCLLVALFLRTGGRLTRMEGALLLFVGLGRWAHAFLG
jgi:cation:H+ antiporter